MKRTLSIEALPWRSPAQNFRAGRSWLICGDRPEQDGAEHKELKHLGFPFVLVGW